MDTFIILLVIAGTAFVGAKIFEGKNRSQAWGAVIGGLFGIIGLLIMACLSKRPDNPPTNLRAL